MEAQAKGQAIITWDSRKLKGQIQRSSVKLSAYIIGDEDIDHFCDAEIHQLATNIA